MNNFGMIAKRIWNSPPAFWLLLSIPGLAMVWDLAAGGSLRGVIHGSGEFSARFFIISLMLTPVMMLFPALRPVRWLVRRRRYLGVAAFGYAALHTLAYLLDKATLDAVTTDMLRTGIWTGWLAFAIFILLALTSNDLSVRSMGSSWKTVQRFAYAAAVLTVAHWYFLEPRALPGIAIHFGPLAALEAWRLWRYFGPARHKATAA